MNRTAYSAGAQVGFPDLLTWCQSILHKLRGYCTPDHFLTVYAVFLKNYNTLVTNKICFLKGSIPRNLITALEFH